MAQTQTVRLTETLKANDLRGMNSALESQLATRKGLELEQESR